MSTVIEKPALKTRELSFATQGMVGSDGDGVKLTRIIGSHELNMLDPFLLLDCFESDQAQDYIGGFPSHPHRGFETVTYLLAGRMRHKDSVGNEGVIEPGGVQWMTAGKGIVHSEMPEQQDGLLMGFQLWVNLPQSAKMTEPGYQEFAPDEVVVEQRADGTEVRVIAGRTHLGTVGPVSNDYTHPIFMDIKLPAETRFEQWVPENHNAFVYVIEGELHIGKAVVGKKTVGLLGPGEQVTVSASQQSCRFLLVSGQRINQPVARGGPFVMNTREEVNQAFEDFRNNRF